MVWGFVAVFAAEGEHLDSFMRPHTTPGCAYKQAKNV